MPIIPELGRVRQDDAELEASLMSQKNPKPK
jgi:hypothetical protein